MKKFLSDVLIDCGLTVNGTASFGTATATTVATSDNSTNIATTAWVKSLGYSTTDSYISGVSLIGNSLSFTGINSAFTGTIDLSSIVTVPVVETVYETVKNVSGNVIYKGTPLAVVEGQTEGFVSDVVPADASDPTKMPALFIANEDIQDEAEGEAVVFGAFSGVDTSLYPSGTIVYVAAGGGWTDTKPVWPNKIQNLGVITKSHPSNGGGIVTGVGRANDIPNLTAGKIWVGSANYPVESTTVHVDEANSRLGIGTTSPTQKLEVNGNIKLSSTVGATATPSYIWLGNDFSDGTTKDKLKIYLYNDGADERYGFSVGNIADVQYHSNVYHDFYTSNSLSLRIDGSGNVGIGTTPNQGVRLQVSGAVDVWNSLNTLLRLEHDGTRGLIQSYTGGGYSSTAISPYGGNVGIGTTSPLHTLYVNGDVGLTDGSRIWFRGSSGSNTTGSQSYIFSDGLNLKIKGDDNVQLLGDGANVILHADYTGNVGIGTTNPLQTLHVSGQRILVDASNAGIMFRTGGVNRYSVASVDGDFQVYDEVNGLNRFYITSAGNVGVGTTSPGWKLDVAGYIRANDRFYATNGTNTIEIGSNYIQSYLNSGAAAAPLIFYIGTAEKVRIASDGNVGIGTDSPSAESNLSLAAKGVSEGGHLTLFKGIGNSHATHIDNYSDSFRIMYGTDSSSAAVQFMLTHGNGNVAIGGFTPAEKLHISGNIRIDGSSTAVILQTGDKTASGSGAVFATYDTTATYGAVVDYVVYDSDRNNMRTGTFTAVWNTNETNYNDVSTVDIGDTSTVTLTSQINGADVELIVTGDTQYTIKFNVKLIK